jgi:hypothetical protein
MRTHGRLLASAECHPDFKFPGAPALLLAPTRRLAVAGGPAAPTGTARHATDGPTAGGCTLATSLNAAARRDTAGRGHGPGPGLRLRVGVGNLKLRTSATPQPLPGPGPGVHSTVTGPAPTCQSPIGPSQWIRSLWSPGGLR